MSSDIVTVHPGSRVEEAAAVMTSRNISCVLIIHKDQVAGILTMKDILKRVIAAEKHPADVQVVDVMSFPVISVAPDFSFFSANRLMDRRHIHRLVVMDGDSVCGIVSQTDVLNALRRAMLD
jgi:CBS domain-containing protein